MERIKDTIQQVMQGLKLKKIASPEHDPAAWLKKTLTKKELGHIRFKYFKNGILYVDVDSSGWLYSLTLKKDRVLSRLTQDKRGVKDIRFRIGETR